MKLRVKVYHGLYGCESGCCGHYITIAWPNQRQGREEFQFDHPSREDDVKHWAREIAEKTIREKWPECLDKIDWDSLDVEQVCNIGDCP